MRITKEEDVAILLVSELARLGDHDVMSLTEVSKRHGVSLLFLKKIASKLRQSGYVTSREGIHGGYRLTKLPTDITVWEIMQAISLKNVLATKDTEKLIDKCPLISVCLPQTIRQTLGQTIEGGLSNVTINMLVSY